VFLTGIFNAIADDSHELERKAYTKSIGRLRVRLFQFLANPSDYPRYQNTIRLKVASIGVLVAQSRRPSAALRFAML
jgi:hypothetical protein